MDATGYRSEPPVRPLGTRRFPRVAWRVGRTRSQVAMRSPWVGVSYYQRYQCGIDKHPECCSEHERAERQSKSMGTSCCDDKRMLAVWNVRHAAGVVRTRQKFWFSKVGQLERDVAAPDARWSDQMLTGSWKFAQ